MQIQRQDAVTADTNNHIGDDFGGNRHAGRARAAILTRVSEVGDNSGDAVGRSTAQGIAQNEQFHDAVIGGMTGRLNNKNVLAADVFL